MRTITKRNRISLLAAVLLTAGLFLMMPAVSYGDAAVEDFWNTAYSVNYDVTVSAPDGGVNIRCGPGTEYEKIMNGMIPNGTVLHIEEAAKANNGKEWGFTDYDGHHGWIFLGQTKKVSASVPASSDTAAPSAPTPVDYNVEVKAPDGGVNIRSGPGAGYDKLQANLIPNGTVLHITETAKADNGKDWGYTTYNGLKGWVFLGQTKATTAAVTENQPAQTQPEAQPAEEAVQEAPTEEHPDSDALVEDDPAEPASSLNSNHFILAILALVILALIVTVVLLLARRKR